jgi:hypothetical protein
VNADINEKTFRMGLGLTWIFKDRLSVILNHDIDLISSQGVDRDLVRHRTGLSVRYTFGIARN